MIHTIFASIWDFSTAAPAPNCSHQSKGSLVQKTWPTEAKIYQRLAAVQSAFSAFSWAPASPRAGASPTGCSGRFIFTALLLYWMGCVKLKGWSAVLTLPGWWVQFAHGSSLLKIFASEVLQYEASQVKASTKWHVAAQTAPHLIICWFFLLVSLTWRLSSYAERVSWPLGIWNLIKNRLYNFKNEWALREDKAVFSFPEKPLFQICLLISVRMAALGGILTCAVNEIISPNYAKTLNI